MAKSDRAKQNLTDQLKAQLGFYQRDLKNERASLKKAKSYIRRGWSNPGLKAMVAQHERGVRKTLTDIQRMKIRIRMRQNNREIFKIL